MDDPIWRTHVVRIKSITFWMKLSLPTKPLQTSKLATKATIVCVPKTHVKIKLN